MFTLAGLSSPIVTWWVSGPIMAACAAVAGWGFWPLVREHVTLPGTLTMMPLHEAARRVYEAVEKAGVLDLTTSPSSAPETKLTHFKLLFVVEDDVELFGIKPPSTKSRLIPKNELHGELYPADGDVSQLGHVASGGPDATYVNVTVRRSDVRRMIKKYLSEYVSQAREMRRGKWPQ